MLPAESVNQTYLKGSTMAKSGQIRIGENIIRSAKSEMQFLKSILDKLELPYVLDDVSFHNTMLDLHRMKTIHDTDVWKVERDGSKFEEPIWS